MEEKMTRKSSTTKSPRRTRKTKTPVRSKILKATGLRNRNFQKSFSQVINHQAFKYVAGGIGLLVLGRLAVKLSDRYPEIGTYVRDGLDQVETKINEFRGGSSSEIAEVDSARH
jgi:hypothetical protein